MENIKIQFKPQVKDHIKAAKLYYSKSVANRTDKTIGLLLVASGAFMLVSYPFVWWYLLLVVFGMLELLGLANLFPLIVRLQYNQNPKFREEFTIEFSESGITFKTPTIDSKLA